MTSISSCCGADVAVKGNTTKYWVCQKCLQACDVVPKSERDRIIEKLEVLKLEYEKFDHGCGRETCCEMHCCQKVLDAAIKAIKNEI